MPMNPVDLIFFDQRIVALQENHMLVHIISIGGPSLVGLGNQVMFNRQMINIALENHNGIAITTLVNIIHVLKMKALDHPVGAAKHIERRC